MMKKKVTSMLLGVALMFTLLVPAVAAEPEEQWAMDYEEKVQEAGEPIESLGVSVARDAMRLLQTAQLKAGDDGSRTDTAYTGEPFYGRDIPTRTLYYSTNLSTKGSASKVIMGVALYDSINGNFYQEVGAKHTVNMKLNGTSYGTPKLSDNKKYYPYLLNTTGGTLTGTAKWYRVEGLS